MTFDEFVPVCGCGHEFEEKEPSKIQVWVRKHPYVTAVIVAFILGFSFQYLSIAGNPYLYPWQKLVQAIVQGTGAVVTVLTVILVMKFLRSFQ